jgi:rhodanese-related sulfurtransferase
VPWARPAGFATLAARNPETAMPIKPTLCALAMSVTLLAFGTPAIAGGSPVADAIEEYMDFTEYGSSLIWPEQIPEEDWKRVTVIDARDAEQFAKGHIPGAVNIEWRRIPGRRGEIPRDRMVVVYCNTGSLSAQSVFAMRLLGWDNVKVLQDGFEGWKAKGGFQANARASRAAGH